MAIENDNNKPIVITLGLGQVALTCGILAPLEKPALFFQYACKSNEVGATVPSVKNGQELDNDSIAAAICFLSEESLDVMIERLETIKQNGFEKEEK